MGIGIYQGKIHKRVFSQEINRRDMISDPRDKFMFPECVLSLNFAEGNGIKTYDSSGKGNDGTLYNLPVWDPKGIFGHAIEFNGVTNKYVRLVGSGSKLNFTGKASWVGWIYPTSSATYDTIISKANDSAGGLTNLESRVSIYNNKIYFSAKTAAGWNDSISLAGLTVNTWNHIGVTYDGSSSVAKFYINGLLNKTNTTPHSGNIEAHGTDPVLGAYWYIDNPCAGGYFHGKLDELLIFNRILSAEEFKMIYDLGKGLAGHC